MLLNWTEERKKTQYTLHCVNMSVLPKIVKQRSRKSYLTTRRLDLKKTKKKQGPCPMWHYITKLWT